MLFNLKDIFPRSKNYKVLIIDSQKSIGDLLEMSGNLYNNLQILHVEGVSHALEKCKNFDIDAVIIHYNENVDLYTEFITEIKRMKNILPTIVIVGDDDLRGSERLELLQAGATFLMNKPFTLDELIVITSNLVELNEVYRDLEHSENVIQALTRAIETRDPYTMGHAEAVAALSVKMFDHMGLRGEQRDDLFLGCLLHDIGKIGIPDTILISPNRLTKEEYEIVKKHPEIGYKICKDLNKLKPSLAIILQHHERLDGSGYPYERKGGDIDILAQICGVADVYHSLTSDRSYRKRMSHEEALKILDKEVHQGKLSLFFVQSLKCVIEESEGCSDDIL